jgi:SPP1 family predicted phage head-tail adaptor
MIAPKTAIGDRPHRVILQNPIGPPIPDGDGGSTQAYVDLTPPALSVKIAPATAQDLERVAAGTVVSQATHLVSAPYHPQVTTQTRLLFNGRSFSVNGLANLEERNVELVLVCTEVVL